MIIPILIGLAVFILVLIIAFVYYLSLANNSKKQVPASKPKVKPSNKTDNKTDNKTEDKTEDKTDNKTDNKCPPPSLLFDEKTCIINRIGTESIKMDGSPKCPEGNKFYGNICVEPCPSGFSEAGMSCIKSL